MSNLSLVEAMLRHTIGYEPLQELNRINDTFPPHDVDKLSDHEYRITLAVAGFKHDEIAVEVHKGTLKVSGQKARNPSEPRRDVDYDAWQKWALSRPQSVHRGIAQRNFEQHFKIGQGVEVEGASLEDGLLVIDLKRQLPEEERPQAIAIKGQARGLPRAK